MAIRRFVVPVTVDAAGDATVYSSVINGSLQSIAYVKTNFADGVDFTITTETTLQTLWAELNVNLAVVKQPRGPNHSTAGVAALYAAGGTAVNSPIAIAGERVKIVVAAGGVSTSGAFHITVDG